jgi:hypothetical protein
MLGDQNPDERVVSTFRYNQAIGRNMHLIAARVQMPRSAVQSVSISVALGFEYSTLTDTPQSVDQIFLNSTGDELVPVPWEQFNAYYRQDTADPRDSGTPREYTTRENVTSGLVIRVGPTPNASDTLKVHLSILPITLASDTTSIPFSDELRRGLESAVAAEIVTSLSDASLKKLGVPRPAAGLWNAQLETVIRDYNLRQQRLGTRQDHIAYGGGRRLRDGRGLWRVA